jgi:hypothetical protein
VIEALHEPRQVAHTVGVAVLVGAHVQLVDHGVLVPARRCAEGRDTRGGFGRWIRRRGVGGGFGCRRLRGRWHAGRHGTRPSSGSIART